VGEEVLGKKVWVDEGGGGGVRTLAIFLEGELTLLVVGLVLSTSPVLATLLEMESVTCFY
jgi:hypothetical protein